MVKHYCDMCGVEIVNQKDIYELEEGDFPDTTYADSKKFIGKELCVDCYYERLAKHISLDLELFNERKEEGRI